MRVKVLEWREEHNAHRVVDESGFTRYVDLTMYMGANVDHEAMIGKVYEYDTECAFLSLACGVREVKNHGVREVQP